jgi:transcriptional regulator with XRE-family HTH domain
MSDIHPSTRNLKELRLLAELTQHELSVILDVRVKTISDWERGLSEPHIPPSKMLLLCNTLKCSLEELVKAIEVGADKQLNVRVYRKKNDKQLVAA